MRKKRKIFFVLLPAVTILVILMILLNRWVENQFPRWDKEEESMYEMDLGAGIQFLGIEERENPLAEEPVYEIIQIELTIADDGLPHLYPNGYMVAYQHKGDFYVIFAPPIPAIAGEIEPGISTHSFYIPKGLCSVKGTYRFHLVDLGFCDFTVET